MIRPEPAFRVSHCESCDEPIIWARYYTTLKAIPVNAAAENDGTLALTWQPGVNPLATFVRPADRFGRRGLHRAHHMTCPAADKHRKRPHTAASRARRSEPTLF